MKKLLICIILFAILFCSCENVKDDSHIPNSSKEQAGNSNVITTTASVPPVTEPIEEEPVKVAPTPAPRPVYTERVVPRATKPAKNTRYVEVEETAREKYTSTMDIELRRTIKILCATRGIMFAQFVEDACREKLKREGVH